MNMPLNKSFLIVYLLIYLIGKCAGLYAQQTEIPPPTPPFINNPPDFSSWNILIADGLVKDSAALKAKGQVFANHTKGIEFFQVSDGQTKKDTWYVNDMVLTTADNDASQVLILASPGKGPPPDGSIGSLNSGPGFPGFWWIGLNNYKGVVKLYNQTCYHYAITPAPEPEPVPAPQMSQVDKVIGGKTFVKEFEGRNSSSVKALEAQAWINVETKLPVALFANGIFHYYTFLPPPASILDLPGPMKSAWQRQRARAERLRKLEQQNR